ncbi:unnamed protein product [Mytilus edulis]|uniref:Uncharacterized protein n=1 Tax=Mytilus edulis TaxID=6550 RepID=A0A8S3TMP6_MYTED|nr:unnamed protein product [Mytilus edulis]
MKTNLLFVVSVLLILECLPGKDIIPCIEGLNRCNGIRECEDGTDEANYTKELTTNELTTELRKSEVRIEETTPQLTTEPITPETTAEPTALDLTPLLTTSHLTTKPTTSDITTVPITSDLSAVPTTSEMTTVPIATTSEMTTVPTTSEMTTVPTTSEMTTVPTTSEMTTVPTTSEMTTVPTTSEMTTEPTTSEMTTEPTSPELTTESVEPAFTTPKLTSISTAPILTTESSLQSDIPVSKSASKSARETTEKRSETTVSTPQIEKNSINITNKDNSFNIKSRDSSINVIYRRNSINVTYRRNSINVSYRKTVSTSTTEETVSTSTTEEIVSTSTTEVKVSTSTTEETVSTSTTEETVSTSTTAETVSKSFIETTVMNTTSKDGILPAERSNTDYIFLYISIPILCILLNILLVFAWKQKFKMRERKHFYSMEREGLSTMSIRTIASVEAFPAENVLMTSALPHHKTLPFQKIVTFYNPEYEWEIILFKDESGYDEQVRQIKLRNQENLNDDFDVSTNSRNVHIYSQPSNGASKCLDNEDSTDLSPMDADEQHKSYNILASENTIVPSRRNSSEFDFKTEYKCTNMDIPSAKTTDLHQKNLNNHCNVLTCSSNVPLSLQPSKLLDNEESKDLSPMNADVQYRATYTTF